MRYSDVIWPGDMIAARSGETLFLMSNTLEPNLSDGYVQLGDTVALVISVMNSAIPKQHNLLVIAFNGLKWLRHVKSTDIILVQRAA